MMFSLFGCGLVGEGAPNNQGLVGRVIRARETAEGGIVSAETRARDFCERGTAAKRMDTLKPNNALGCSPQETIATRAHVERQATRLLSSSKFLPAHTQKKQ